MKVSLPGARWNYYVHTYPSWRWLSVGLTFGKHCFGINLPFLLIEVEW